MVEANLHVYQPSSCIYRCVVRAACPPYCSIYVLMRASPGEMSTGYEIVRCMEDKSLHVSVSAGGVRVVTNEVRVNLGSDRV